MYSVSHLWSVHLRKAFRKEVLDHKLCKDCVVNGCVWESLRTPPSTPLHKVQWQPLTQCVMRATAIPVTKFTEFEKCFGNSHLCKYVHNCVHQWMGCYGPFIDHTIAVFRTSEAAWTMTGVSTNLTVTDFPAPNPPAYSTNCIPSAVLLRLGELYSVHVQGVCLVHHFVLDLQACSRLFFTSL